MNIRPHDRFSTEVTLTPEVIECPARGHIVDLRGRIRGEDGRTAVGAKGRVFVTDKL